MQIFRTDKCQSIILKHINGKNANESGGGSGITVTDLINSPLQPGDGSPVTVALNDSMDNYDLIVMYIHGGNYYFTEIIYPKVLETGKTFLHHYVGNYGPFFDVNSMSNITYKRVGGSTVNDCLSMKGIKFS